MAAYVHIPFKYIVTYKPEVWKHKIDLKFFFFPQKIIKFDLAKQAKQQVIIVTKSRSDIVIK